MTKIRNLKRGPAPDLWMQRSALGSAISTATPVWAVIEEARSGSLEFLSLLFGIYLLFGAYYLGFITILT